MTKTQFLFVYKIITYMAIEIKVVGVFFHIESFKNDSPYTLKVMSLCAFCVDEQSPHSIS